MGAGLDRPRAQDASGRLTSGWIRVSVGGDGCEISQEVDETRHDEPL